MEQSARTHQDPEGLASPYSEGQLVIGDSFRDETRDSPMRTFAPPLADSAETRHVGDG